jgi:hypothetical protein
MFKKVVIVFVLLIAVGFLALLYMVYFDSRTGKPLQLGALVPDSILAAPILSVTLLP